MSLVLGYQRAYQARQGGHETRVQGSRPKAPIRIVETADVAVPQGNDIRIVETADVAVPQGKHRRRIAQYAQQAQRAHQDQAHQARWLGGPTTAIMKGQHAPQRSC